MAEEGECNTSLALAIGTSGTGQFASTISHNCGSKPAVQFHVLFPHHPAHPKDEEEAEIEEEGEQTIRRRHRSLSSRSNKNLDDEEVISDKDHNTRKKLKLTKEQVTLLEDSFREHNTLNTTQKQDLADRLSIQPRQVEVWFQNRRARTKLKQIEVDCEFLKKCCESLSDENQRLKDELQELRSSARPGGSPFYIHQYLLKAATTLSMCPFCKRTTSAAGGSAATGTSIKSTGLLRPKN